MSLKVWNGDVWQTASKVWVRDGDTWKLTSSVAVRDSATWKRAMGGITGTFAVYDYSCEEGWFEYLFDRTSPMTGGEVMALAVYSRPPGSSDAYTQLSMSNAFDSGYTTLITRVEGGYTSLQMYADVRQWHPSTHTYATAPTRLVTEPITMLICA